MRGKQNVRLVGIYNLVVCLCYLNNVWFGCICDGKTFIILIISMVTGTCSNDQIKENISCPFPTSYVLSLFVGPVEERHHSRRHDTKQ